jgi:citrate lyase subunit beta/citryl-CoA lyase
MALAKRRRSMHFVPGGNEKMIAKALTLPADGLILDLEDAVAPDRKVETRPIVTRWLRELDFGGRARLLRINALDTPFAWRDLTEVFEAAGDRIDLVMLPKANRPRDVEFVETLLSQIGADRIGIEAQIETASGFLYAREIAQSSPRLEALIFGPGDYSASLQMPATSIGEFDAHGAQLLGVSVDGVFCHAAYAKKKGLRFPLLSDFQPRGAVASLYGAFREDDGVCERALFVIDAAGVIRWNFLSPIDVSPGADGILRALESLRGK